MITSRRLSNDDDLNTMITKNGNGKMSYIAFGLLATPNHNIYMCVCVCAPIRLCNSQVSFDAVHNPEAEAKTQKEIKEGELERGIKKEWQALNVIFRYAIVSLEQIPTKLLFSTSASTNSVIHIYNVL